MAPAGVARSLPRPGSPAAPACPAPRRPRPLRWSSPTTRSARLPPKGPAAAKSASTASPRAPTSSSTTASAESRRSFSLRCPGAATRSKRERPATGPWSSGSTTRAPGARYTLVMRPLTGRLALAVLPAEARVTVGTVEVAAGVHELPAGTYTVRATAFGYLDAERTLEVRADSLTSLEIALEPAPFAARLAGVSRRRLDPEIQGEGGRAVLAWQATASATAALRVFTQAGSEVYAAPAGGSEGPRGQVAWDGRASDGQAVPDGSYRLVIELRSARGDQAAVETSVTVSRRPLTLPASQWSGVAGMQYAPTPEVAAPGAGAFVFTSGVILAPGESAPVESAPVAAAARAGLAAAARARRGCGGAAGGRPSPALCRDAPPSSSRSPTRRPGCRPPPSPGRRSRPGAGAIPSAPLPGSASVCRWRCNSARSRSLLRPRSSSRRGRSRATTRTTTTPASTPGPTSARASRCDSAT